MNTTLNSILQLGARLAGATVLVSCTLLAAADAQAAVHGITGGATSTFNLTASAGSISQPDGASIYAWGYGCNGAPAGYLPSLAGAGPAPNCGPMQLPGPTLIVHQGDLVTVVLTNNLPTAAGNTSIVFAGQSVAYTGGTSGLLTQEAAKGATVTYSFTPSQPGSYAYYSGTQPDVQIEMGLTGALVVLPTAANQAAACGTKVAGPYSNAVAAYPQADTCYDREYLFQFSELSSSIHDQVKAQVDACGVAPSCAQIAVAMEPYRPNYFMINGRSMPDIMDTPYSGAYPNQPYNGNPHMHPGEKVLMRVVGQGQWQHPFHFHGNHARVLARDGNLILSKKLKATDPDSLAGPTLFTIATVAGQTVDAIFTWTGQGLNWDIYGLDPSGHTCLGKPALDAQGRNKFTKPASAYDPTSTGFDTATREYCLDHGKPIPATPPDPSIVVNGQWYGGTPYIGMQAANPTPEAPGTLNQNPQAGYAYMWHSHNEREITTNDVFPGGMLMMLLIDPFSFAIDETL